MSNKALSALLGPVVHEAIAGADHVDNILVGVEREATVGNFRAIAERFERIAAMLRDVTENAA